MNETAAVPLSHPLERGTAGHLPASRDSAGIASGTTSLKALAKKPLQRDTPLDGDRDRGNGVVPVTGPAVGQLGDGARAVDVAIGSDGTVVVDRR
jgi:hypothetical protein